MVVVIFKAKLRQTDSEYPQLAQRLRTLAMEEFGCLAFDTVTEGETELTLSYWPAENAIKSWKAQTEHLAAQRLGRNAWYESYTVQVAQIVREYRFDSLLNKQSETAGYTYSSNKH